MFSFLKRILLGMDKPELTAEALRNGAYLIDVRSKGEFAGGSAPEAVNIPMSEIRNQLEKIKKKKEVVVFCRSGSRSGMAKRILKEAGMTAVYNGGSLYDIREILNS